MASISKAYIIELIGEVKGGGFGVVLGVVLPKTAPKTTPKPPSKTSFDFP